ncbi:ABC transporter substrate-binding protein/permease [Pediococcus argentinicus]|uniref:ABC transporter substrate-binding protein/permease n=1 Tax=Pediococcus argentinicus TaxID=480391 RepID=UPI003F494BF6
MRIQLYFVITEKRGVVILKKAIKFSVLIMMVVTFIISGLTGVVSADDQKGKTDQASTELYNKIKKRGYLVVGLSANYAPMEFHATVKGEDTIVGADVSVAKKVAHDMGVKLQVKEMDFDALIGAMKTGKIDMIISGMTNTPERAKEVLFSKPYMFEKQAMVIRKSDQDKYKGILDFKGAKVGAQTQSVQAQIAKQQLPNAKIMPVAKSNYIAAEIVNHKLDAGVLASEVAGSYVYQNKSLKVIYPKFVTPTAPTAIAMPLHATALKAQVDKSVNQIQSQKLFPKYLKDAYQVQKVNQSFFAKYNKFFIDGTIWTLAFAAISVIFGSIIGTLLAIMKIGISFILKAIANVYIEFIRGTPLMVQAFMVFFGTQIIGFNLSPFVAGAIAMAINSGAYVAEIIRSGINSVSDGQSEAAASLGLNRSKALRYVILPQALKNIWPALGNEFVTVIKESSVLSVIGATELMFQASNVQGASFKPFLPIFIVAMIYFVLTFGISRILNLIEKRFV